MGAKIISFGKVKELNSSKSSEETFLQRKTVIDWFGDVENFKYSHEEKLFQSSELWKSWEWELE